MKLLNVISFTEWRGLLFALEVYGMDKQKHIRVFASDPWREYPFVVAKELEG